jgi:hypothetical protein
MLPAYQFVAMVGNAALNSRERSLTVSDKVLFFLLFSGPPKFRLRDPTASLDSIFDWVVILHLVVWAWAGAWVSHRLWLLSAQHKLRFSWPEKVSLLMGAALCVSIHFSDSPTLTAFKVYQLLVTILFVGAFLRLHGLQAALDGIFTASAVLCLADALAAFLAPSLVFGESEFGSVRFRGDLLAQTGVVAPIALVLLLASYRRRSKLLIALGMTLFGSVLLFSLTRTSYFAFVAFLTLALWKAPQIGLLKKVARWAFVLVPIAAAAGAFAHLEEYRPAESLWTLSDRIGLWTYLIDTMWTQSPFFGLGYFSASRIYGPQYNAGLGTAHSVFVEILAGGGAISFSIFLVIWSLLLFYVVRLFLRPMTATCFAVLGLLLVTFCLVFVGSELEADPAGFTLWVIVASLPALSQRSTRQAWLDTSVPSTMVRG